MWWKPLKSIIRMDCSGGFFQTGNPVTTSGTNHPVSFCYRKIITNTLIFFPYLICLAWFYLILSFLDFFFFIDPSQVSLACVVLSRRSSSYLAFRRILSCFQLRWLIRPRVVSDFFPRLIFPPGLLMPDDFVSRINYRCSSSPRDPLWNQSNYVIRIYYF